MAFIAEQKVQLEVAGNVEHHTILKVDQDGNAWLKSKLTGDAPEGPFDAIADSPPGRFWRFPRHSRLDTDRLNRKSSVGAPCGSSIWLKSPGRRTPAKPWMASIIAGASRGSSAAPRYRAGS